MATESNYSYTERNDVDLAALAAGGDAAAFETLYHRHMRRVYALCLRMTGNPTEAEDLVQEVFTQLLRKIGAFRAESAFTTWLHRMAVNQVLMHFRRQQSRPQFVVPEEDDESAEDIVRSTEHASSMPVIDRLSLQKAIAALAPGYRSIFVLHDVEGSGRLRRMPQSLQ